LSSGSFAFIADFSLGDASVAGGLSVRIDMARSLVCPNSLEVNPEALSVACSARLSIARWAS
jgi:hypothetical protein